MQTVDFFGLPLLAGEGGELADWLVDRLQDRASQPRIIAHVNANNYYHLHRESQLGDRLSKSAYLLFDGVAMRLAAWGLSRCWLEDANGTDLFPLVMERLARDRTSIYLLGGSDRVLQSTIQAIETAWPSLRIAGSTSGYFRPDEEAQVVGQIAASGADVLLIGRGFPLQEQFSLCHRFELTTVSLIWNVGGLFDFISGLKPRAPWWIRNVGLEWLFRLAIEPRRLWQRTFIVGPWLLHHLLVQGWVRHSKIEVRGIFPFCQLPSVQSQTADFELESGKSIPRALGDGTSCLKPLAS